MRVSEVMTRGVRTVGPEDTVADAARIMARFDVGALPVACSGKPLGIVTDRDIAIRAAGKGCKPTRVKVRQVMSRGIVAAAEQDDLGTISRLMQRKQIRRIPVLDDRGIISGIVSLGDLAVRGGEDARLGDVLEDVSRPGRPRGLLGTVRSLAPSLPRLGGAPTALREDRARGPVVRAGMAGGLALALLAFGAAAMFFLDPNRGRRRRAVVRDRTVSAAHRVQDLTRKAAIDARQRARGAVARTRSKFRAEGEVGDEVLRERVRSALGRAASHPHAIRVDTAEGCVCLSGSILAHEVDAVLRAVQDVRGVQSVEDCLDVYADPSDVPALQGAGPRPRDPGRVNWSPTARFMATVGGGALTIWGVSRRDGPGLGAAVIGAALAARGATDLPVRRLTGIGAGRRAIYIDKAININAPPRQVFEFFAHPENFPSVMSNVKEVRDLGDDRSHWVVAGPAGMNVEWFAATTCREPERCIAWESEPGSPIANTGFIRFVENPRGGTRVDIHLSYNPPGGALGHLAARIFGADPKSEMDADLARAKTLIETVNVPHDAATAIQPMPAGDDAGPH